MLLNLNIALKVIAIEFLRKCFQIILFRYCLTIDFFLDRFVPVPSLHDGRIRLLGWKVVCVISGILKYFYFIKCIFC